MLRSTLIHIDVVWMKSGNIERESKSQFDAGKKKFHTSFFHFHPCHHGSVTICVIFSAYAHLTAKSM